MYTQDFSFHRTHRDYLQLNELFFSSNQKKFSVLGTEDDLEYYVRECGDILGVSSKLPSSVRNAKHILDYIFHQIVEFKKLNQVPATLTSLLSVHLMLGFRKRASNLKFPNNLGLLDILDSVLTSEYFCWS